MTHDARPIPRPEPALDFDPRAPSRLIRRGAQRLAAINTPVWTVAWSFHGYGDKTTKDSGWHSRQRPTTAELLPANIPAELAAQQRWICWDWASGGSDVWLKPSISAITGGTADVTDGNTWASLTDALAFAHRHRLAGIGYVLTGEDGLAVIDLDDCRDPETGKINERELAWINALNSYSEASPSGAGAHVFIRTTAEISQGPIMAPDIWTRDKYITVTGQRIPGTPPCIRDWHDAWNDLALDQWEGSYSFDHDNFPDYNSGSLHVIGGNDEILVVKTWDGHVHAIGLASGKPHWSAVAARLTRIHRDAVVLQQEPWADSTGLHGGVVAVDLASGRANWRRDDLQVYYESLHVSDKVVILEAWSHVLALSRLHGRELWRINGSRSNQGATPQWRWEPLVHVLHVTEQFVLTEDIEHFRVLHAESGHELWRTDPIRAGSDYQERPATSADNHLVIATTPDVHHFLCWVHANTISAVELATGKQRWVAHIAAEETVVEFVEIVTAAHGVLVVKVVRWDTGLSRLVGIDARTGREIWQREDVLAVVVAEPLEAVVFVRFRENIQAIVLPTGQTISTMGDDLEIVGASHGMAYAIDESGRMVLHDMMTGKRIATIRVGDNLRHGRAQGQNTNCKINYVSKFADFVVVATDHSLYALRSR